MKDIIKQVLDEFVDYAKQINLDSNSAREILAAQIAKAIEIEISKKNEN